MPCALNKRESDAVGSFRSDHPSSPEFELSLLGCGLIGRFGFSGDKEALGDSLERGDAGRDGSGDDELGDLLGRLVAVRGTEAISFCGSTCMRIGGRTPRPPVEGGE